MRYSVTFQSSLDDSAIRSHIDRMLHCGPFVLTCCDAVGPRIWELEFVPRAQHLAISFAKFAELQLQLARCGEVLSLRRRDSKAIA